MDEPNLTKNTILFTRLLLTFQTNAMQQMGKLADPWTGNIARDLDQARIAIDTLDMLRDRCRGNMTNEEERFLGHILAELKLNYVDELGRPDPTPSEPAATDGNSTNAAQ